MKNSKNCIDACLVCSFECENCATTFIELNDKKFSRLISLCRDCADMCALCARLEARGSSFVDRMAKLCTDLCKACATECEKLPVNDFCLKVADACRECIAIHSL